jgi:hypothetical protein
LTLPEPPTAVPPALPAMPAAKLVRPTSPMRGKVSVIGRRVADAVMLADPLAVAVAFLPMLALVSRPLTMLTETATPTPVPPSVLSAAP